MVHCSRRRMLGTLLALVALIALTALLVFVGQARAGEPVASPEPTVVREVVAKRTQYATTYLMSDGTERTVIYQAPIHFKDETGAWRPIDRSLLPVDGLDVYATTSTPVEVRLADEAPGQKPVTVTKGEWSVSMQLVGFPEDEKLVLGDSAVYTDVAPDTDVAYTVTGDGVKELITLASPSAPNVFTYRLSHPGLELRRDDAGQSWALYALGERKPVFYIGAVNASDSSHDEIDEPAWCPDARMTVTPGADASTIVLSVPRAWLTDSARVYPVQIDPNIADDTTKDTFLSQGLPTQSFGTLNELFCGRMNSSEGKCRTLVRFPEVSTIEAPGEDRHILSSTFQLYEYWQPATHTDTVYTDKLSASSVLWQDASTYNSANSQLYTDYSLGSQNVTAGNWMSVESRSAVQSWLDGEANRGFIVYEPDSAGSGWSRKFRSVNYPSSSAWPKLIVESETPTTTTTGAPTVAYIGDTVSVTVTGNASSASEITSLQLGINRAAGQTSRTRGLMCWYPSGVAAPSGSWGTPISVSGGGYAAVSTSAGDHCSGSTSAITLLSASHSGAATTFTFRIEDDWIDTWGDCQDTTFDSRLDMSSGSHASWHSAWFTGSGSLDVLPTGIPGGVTGSGESINPTSWFIGLGPNDSNAAGRAILKLDWAGHRAPGATGYHIYLYDGNTIQWVDDVAVGTTNWSSSGKHLFPSDTTIRSWPYGWQGNPFASGTLELRDDPNEMYNKLFPSGSNPFLPHYYWGYVIPFNSGGWARLASSGWSNFCVTMPGRSIKAQEEQHTTADLGGWDGHSLAARLDDGKLSAHVTDLAIASLGPAAEVSRSYLSGATTSPARYAPGWFFNFDQKLVFNLAGTPASVTYVDEQNVSHVFYRANANAPWVAPNGFFAGLTQNPDASWKLLFDDQHYLTFADATGVLLSETDARGLQATYAWQANALTITAANGQTIGVSFAGGMVTGASYAVGTDARTASYAASAPWQVTYNDGDQPTERTVSYTYATYGSKELLTDVTQPGWPEDGQSAVLHVAYASTDPYKVTRLEYPDYNATSKPDARATITYDSSTQATVRHFGTVAGVDNQEMRQIAFTWDATTSTTNNLTVAGRAKTEAETTASGTATTTYTYGDDQQVASEKTEVAGATVSRSDAEIDADVMSGSHDIDSEATATEIGANGEPTAAQRTDYVYDALHRVAKQTTYRTYDPQHPDLRADPTTTLYTYDGYGNVYETQVRDGNETGTLISDVKTTYDAAGRLTKEEKWVSGSSWTETDYSNFAVNGEPQTILAKHVQLSYGGAAQDLTRSASYDGFGNLLSQSDWGGRTTEANTYDLAGRMLTSTDAAGITRSNFYDVLGNLTESYRTAGTSMQADWRLTAYDAMGRATEVTTQLCDENGSPTTQSVVTNVYDGSGNQLSRHDTTVGGEDEKWLYDAQGNVTKHWALGVKNYTDDARSTRTAYDAQNRATGVSDPGNTALPGAAGSATTTYNDGGQVTAEAKPDGSSTTYLYDDEANQTTAESTVTGTLTSTYGADGRLGSQTNERGFATGSSYDGLGRVVGASGSGQNPTTTTYNDLGWVLRTVDASGVTTLKGYDAHGEVIGETVGSQGTTVSVYDSTTGRLFTRTDPNGTKITYTYDLFGNVKRELHQASDNSVLKDLGDTNGLTYDSLGRPISRTEVVSGRSQSWTYPADTAGGIQETLTYSSQTSTDVNRNPRGQEISRETDLGAGANVTLTIVDDNDHRDAADRWTSATITPSAGSAQTLGRSFDGAGRVTSQSGSGFAAAGSYDYHAASGLKAAQTLPLSIDAASAYDNYAYAADGRLQTWSVRATPTATPSPMATYSYSASGNLTGDTGTGTTYAYDSANRLTSSLRSGATTYYGWDTANGWRTCQGPNANPTPTNEPIVYTYVKSGASTSSGRMTRYQNSTTSTDASYACDAAGQRTESVVTVGSTTTTTTYDYDGLALLSLSATQGSPTWRVDYLYDEEGTPYGGVYRSPATSTSPVYFTMITNDHGDVLELLDASGAAFASYRYDPWGLPLASGTTTTFTTLIGSTLASDIASRQILRYASYAYDAESGLYYCSARYYDPATRQWTTCDAAKADGEESAYQYCEEDPVGSCDPSGLFTSPRRGSCKQKGHKITLWQFFHYAENSSRYIVIEEYWAWFDSGRARVHIRPMTYNISLGSLSRMVYPWPGVAPTIFKSDIWSNEWMDKTNNHTDVWWSDGSVHKILWNTR